jgi:hypothetical protein
MCGAVIPAAILGSATTTDDSGIVTITVSGVPAGNVFPVGTTAVTYTATDVVNFTASVTQRVTVVDTTPPVLSTPANVTVNATSPAGAVVTYTLPAATDNCPGVSVAGVPPPAALSPSARRPGKQTPHLDPTHAAGNEFMAPRRELP